jgi:hypothetical protein
MPGACGSQHPASGLFGAVAVGFEPTEGVNPHALSRRAPSAARTRYRDERYRTVLVPAEGG